MSGPKPLADCPGLQGFLRDERTATVALPIDEVGIHAATLLYYHTEQPLRFYFVTGRSSEKCRLLKEVDVVNGACVVGTVAGTPFTLQMRGQFTIIEAGDNQAVVEAYYQKRGGRSDDINDPENVLVSFTPHWARFTDYTHGRYDRFLLRLET